MLGRQRVRDHRGRPVPLLPRPKLLFGPGGGCLLVLLLIAWPFATAIVVTLEPLVASLAAGSRLAAAVVWMAAAAIGVVMVAAVAACGRRERRAAVVMASLGEGRCPSCGYEFKMCGVEADGCCVCPECGAAWRLAREGPSTDPEARLWRSAQDGGA